MKILGLYNVADMVTPLGLSSEGEAFFDFGLVVPETWVNLHDTWLVLESLPELLEMLWSRRQWVVDLSFDAGLSGFVFNGLTTSSPNVGNGIFSVHLEFQI